MTGLYSSCNDDVAGASARHGLKLLTGLSIEAASPELFELCQSWPTSAAGSPGRRSASIIGMGLPVTALAVSMTSRTEKPLPLPRLKTSVAPP